MGKKIMLAAVALLCATSVYAAPRYKGLDNRHGKTTIRIEIPASDRDESNGLSIDDVRLYNDGKILSAKKVDAIWGDDSTIILQFKKLTHFKDCILSFTVNGTPVSVDIQKELTGR